VALRYASLVDFQGREVDVYTAQAVDRDGPYPVFAVIDATHGNEIAGTFTEG
jgi:hypothetical protein